jgi:hypothetical protein
MKMITFSGTLVLNSKMHFHTWMLIPESFSRLGIMMDVGKWFLARIPKNHVNTNHVAVIINHLALSSRWLQ